MKLRELTDADNLGRQVSRWAKGEPRPPGDVVYRALLALGAIRLEVLTGPQGSDAGDTDRLGKKAARALDALPPPAEPQEGTK